MCIRDRQYTATVYNSITTLADSEEIILRGSADENAVVAYSVNGYEGVSIDANGLLTITGAAEPGEVQVTASYGGHSKDMTLLLKPLGDADTVEIFGDEVIAAGESKNYTAIPIADGVVLPSRDTKWELIGSGGGVEISEDGMLTAASDAQPGIITVKATLLSLIHI